MIHLFNSRGRILFFPVKWANAVASWILGLHSPSGTIRVSNTANPSESGGASVDVDMEVVAAKTKERLTGHFQTKREVEASIERAADGSSIVARDRRLHVSEDWLRDKFSESSATIDPSAAISPVASSSSSGSSTNAAPSDHVHAMQVDNSLKYDSTSGKFGVKVDSGGGLEIGTNGLSMSEIGDANQTLVLASYKAISETKTRLYFWDLEIDATGRVIGRTSKVARYVDVGPAF